MFTPRWVRFTDNTPVSQLRLRTVQLIALAALGAACASSQSPLVVNAYYGAASAETSLSTLIATGATSRLTDLTYAFAAWDNYTASASNPCAGVPTTFPGGSVALISTTDIQNLRKQNPNIKVLISIGGAGSTTVFENAIAKGIDSFADSCVNTLLGAYPGYIDGIDIDWEYPASTTDEQNYNLLVQAFRTHLTAYAQKNNITEHLLLTSAVGPEYQMYGWQFMDFAGKTYPPAANTFVDFYNVEFYGYSDNGEPNTYSDAPIHDINNDIYGSSDYGAAGLIPVGGMPASKIVVGVPFYGVHYTGVTGTNAGCQLGGSGTLDPSAYTYPDIVAVVTGPNAATYDSPGCPTTAGITFSNGVFNDTDGSAWSWDKVTGDFYEYDNATAISQKDSYITSKGLAGEFSWNLQDDTSSGTLLSAMPSQALTYKDVSASVSVTTPNGMTYNKIKQTGSETFVIKNNTSSAITGPIQLVLWQLPAGVTATNNNGTFSGSPYWTVTAGSLLAGGSMQFTVTLSYKAGDTPIATVNVYSGAF